MAMFNLLYSSTNQQLFKIFCNQSSHYENYGQFTSTKLALFMVNKDTKKGLVSLWRMHYMYSSMAKGTHLSGWSSKKTQACSLSHCQVTWVWRHQAVSQYKILFKKFLLKLHSNFLKAFQVDLSFYYPILPNRHLRKLIFRWIYFVVHRHIFVIPTMNYYCGSW